MNCRNPLDAAQIADYWLAGLAKADEDAVEEHLFVCDECAARLREVIALSEAVRKVAREGGLQMIVSETFLRRAAEEGLRIREYAPPAGGSVHCTVTAEDDLLVARLAANLNGANRVDLSLCDEHGVERDRLPDIPFHSGAGSVAWQPSMRWAKTAPTSTLHARLLACDETGIERLLGEYTFRHTRTLP